MTKLRDTVAFSRAFSRIPKKNVPALRRHKLLRWSAKSRHHPRALQNRSASARIDLQNRCDLIINLPEVFTKEEAE